MGSDGPHTVGEQGQLLLGHMMLAEQLPDRMHLLAELGVSHCFTHVTDGSTRYYGPSFHRVEGPALHERMQIHSERRVVDLREWMEYALQRQVEPVELHAALADVGVDAYTLHVGERLATFYDSDENVMLVTSIGDRRAPLN